MIITNGDGPSFQLVDYRLTFDKTDKSLIKMERIADLGLDNLHWSDWFVEPMKD